MAEKNTYLVSVHNLFINLCQFQWQVTSTDTFDHLFFGESFKLESVWELGPYCEHEV